MAKIKVIQHEEAKGRLKEIYDDLVSSRGKLAEVHMIQSLRPESIVKHMDLYMEIMYSKSELSRAFREMMAVIVSKANNCEYCQIHHAEALNNYWKDDNKIMQLRKDYRELQLTEKEFRLCELAELLTKVPGISKSKDITEPLKEIGFSDAAILDAVLVISYFNFVNRIVLSLGVEIENDSGTGYKY
jgi:uncharacterized peroxidase-related enzyme